MDEGPVMLSGSARYAAGSGARPAAGLPARCASGLAVVLSLWTLAACGGSSPTGPVDPSDLNYVPELGVDLALMTRTSSGLYLLDEVVGDGEEAQAGDRVTVHYTGWFHDGVKFDSSFDRGEPFTVTNLGNANVIAGWNEGLQGMREGGRRLLVIPPSLAYGAGPILGRSWPTLVFRVEMLEVER